MKAKKIGSKFRITFTYIEWVKAGKKMPPIPDDIELNNVKEYVIHDVPEDKKEFFEKFGWRVVLAVSKGKGMHLNK